MKLEPMGTLATSVRVGDVISLFVMSTARFIVNKARPNIESNETGQHIELMRLYPDSINDHWHLCDDRPKTSIVISDKPVTSRTDHYTHVYVHGHYDVTKEAEMRLF